MNYQVPIDVIHNGIDISAIKPNTLKSHNPPRIVFAGRFVPQKQPLMIVDILSELSDQLWEAVMMGNGPQLNKVKETIMLRNLQDRISITGWVAPEEVIQKFSQSDILLMPSISEGLPIAGIQALASGLAFIVSNIGGFKDMVDDGSNGYLIPFEDKKTFIARLRLLLSDSDHLNYLRENSLKKASLFDSKRMVADYERILLSVIKTD
jgi:glycosyltransferase involved in cell wall biosynthesis